MSIRHFDVNQTSDFNQKSKKRFRGTPIIPNTRYFQHFIKARVIRFQLSHQYHHVYLANRNHSKCLDSCKVQNLITSWDQWFQSPTIDQMLPAPLLIFQLENKTSYYIGPIIKKEISFIHCFYKNFFYGRPPWQDIKSAPSQNLRPPRTPLILTPSVGGRDFFLNMFSLNVSLTHFLYFRGF